jgi:hypothetical protein
VCKRLRSTRRDTIADRLMQDQSAISPAGAASPEDLGELRDNPRRFAAVAISLTVGRWIVLPLLVMPSLAT